MARGKRKTMLEKLTEEHHFISETIEKHKNCINQLEEKKISLEDEIAKEQYKELEAILATNGITMEELISLVPNLNSQASA